MRLGVLLMAALGGLGNWAAAFGQSITYGFSGRVVASYWSLLDELPVLHDDDVAWLPEVNGAVSGRITLDTSLPLHRRYSPPGVPSWLPLEGTFVAPSAVEVTIGGHRWSSSVLGISVDDDFQRPDGSVIDSISFASFSMVSAEVPTEHYSLYLSRKDLGSEVYQNGEWTRDLTSAEMKSGGRTNMLAFAATGPPLWFSIESWDRAVPEPSGLILLGMGLCGIWRRHVR